MLEALERRLEHSPSRALNANVAVMPGKGKEKTEGSGHLGFAKTMCDLAETGLHLNIIGSHYIFMQTHFFLSFFVHTCECGCMRVWRTCESQSPYLLLCLR